ncbi:MAG: Peptidase M15A [uncultured bacterium]|nr:MAG: Peptidase M15A [uncultured bacterium]
MQLTPHFSMEEVTESEYAVRYGIDNQTTDEHILANIKVAALGMEQVRMLLGHPCKINSWLRVEELEKIAAHKDYIGWCKRRTLSVDDASWFMYFTRKGHPKGYCIDFTCRLFGTPAEVVAKIRASGIRYDQLICEGTWVHISFAPAMRGEVLTATFIKGEPSYTTEA